MSGQSLNARLERALNALKLTLRPAGGGVYVVSTGLAEQRQLQRAIYQSSNDEMIETEWIRTLKAALEFQQFDEEKTSETSETSEIINSGLLILGVPSDTGAGFTRGANLAPAQLRSYLMNTHPNHPLLGASALDVGDVRVVPQLLSDEMLSPQQLEATRQALYPDEPTAQQLPVSPLDITYDSLSLIAAEEIHRPLTPIVIGGDHSVGWPAFKAAFDRWETPGRARLGLLHFDAHTDLLSERLGVKYCFATWAWHANQLLGEDGRLVQVGIRASGRDRAHWESTCNVRQYWAREARELGAVEVGRQIIERFESLGVTALYVSNDIDGTDSLYASATGTPEPNGLMPDEVDQITRIVGERFPLIGADLVEIAPPLSREKFEPERTFETATQYLRTLCELGLSRSPIR